MTLLRRLGSAKTAAALMAALAACTLVSFLIPQRALVGEEIYQAWRTDSGAIGRAAETVGLEHVFTSWLFIALMALLAVNLIACMLVRVERRRRAAQATAVAPPDSALSVAVRTQPARALSSALAGWSVQPAGDGRWVCRSGRRGWWGSMALHVGLLVLLAAGVVSALTRFSGTVVLAEGQGMTDSEEAYYAVTQSPRVGSAFTGAQLSLQRMEFTYEGDVIVDAAAVMRRAEDGQEVVARVNHPFRAGGKAYLLSATGLAAGLRVQRDGVSLAEGVVNLGKRVPEGYSDTFPLPDGRSLVVTAVADRAVAKGVTATRLYVLTDPVVRLSIANAGGELQLAPGEQGKLGDLSVAVSDVRRWTSFNVRADKGLPIAYLGFALVLLGMLARWLDPDVRLDVALSEDGRGALIWHSTRYGTGAAARAVSRVAKSFSNGEAV